MNPHRPHKTAPSEIYASFVRNRRLIRQMAKRDVLGRYRGSMIGLAWAFFNPLLMLGVYTFFFSFVLKARWGVDQDGGHTDFAIVLFVGLIIHGLFAECINRAPNLINSNASFVKKVIFPLEVLPWIAMGSAVFQAAISVLILLTLQLLINDAMPWTVLLFPLVVAPFIFMTLGFAWFFSAIGVYLRDVGQVSGLLTSVLLFMSPVFYPVSFLPPPMDSLVLLNPLTLIIEESRKVLLFGQMPNWIALGLYSLIAALIAWLGFWWFQKTRKGFADVI